MASALSPKQLSQARIEIPIPTRKRFVPGTAPQPLISLLPAHDSTAVILDKVLLEEGSGKGALLQLCYVITWTDFPSKRATVSCAKALEYVSPREMEDWEYKYTLRREEEAREKATKATKPATWGKMPLEEMRVKKRQGQPLRTDMEGKELIIRRRAVRSSLSTARKRRQGRFPGDKNEHDGMHGVVHLQLFNDPGTEALKELPPEDGVSAEGDK